MTNSIFIDCDYFLDMKGGNPSLQKKMCLEVKESRIKNIFPLNSTEEKKRKLNIKNIKPYQSSKINEKRIYLKDHLIMPGLINSHTHLPMSLFRGLGEELSFHEWLFECILPIERKILSPHFVKIGAELSALECIDKGITTVFDMYPYAENIAQVFENYGLRGFFGEDINNTCLEVWPQRMDSLSERYLDHKRIHPALAPHAPYTCENNLLKKVVQYNEKKGLPIFIHVSETKKEVDDSLKKYNLSPVKRLNQLGLTGNNSLFIHAVWLSSEDIDILQKTNTSISYNPESNMKLSSGISPIGLLLKKGVNVGLGTDGAASNNDLNLFAEMDFGLKLQKLNLKENEQCIVSSKDMLKMVTWNGAFALNLENEIGSLEEGKLADLIAIDLNDPSFYPREDLLSHLVFSSSRVVINLVMCHGKILKYKQKRFVGRDERLVFEEIEKLRNKMTLIRS